MTKASTFKVRDINGNEVEIDYQQALDIHKEIEHRNMRADVIQAVCSNMDLETVELSDVAKEYCQSAIDILVDEYDRKYCAGANGGWVEDMDACLDNNTNEVRELEIGILIDAIYRYTVDMDFYDHYDSVEEYLEQLRQALTGNDDVFLDGMCTKINELIEKYEDDEEAFNLYNEGCYIRNALVDLHLWTAIQDDETWKSELKNKLERLVDDTKTMSVEEAISYIKEIFPEDEYTWEKVDEGDEYFTDTHETVYLTADLDGTQLQILYPGGERIGNQMAEPYHRICVCNPTLEHTCDFDLEMYLFFCDKYNEENSIKIFIDELVSMNDVNANDDTEGKEYEWAEGYY